MQNQENATPTIRKRVPWNKGKLTGAKPPLRPRIADITLFHIPFNHLVSNRQQRRGTAGASIPTV
jgi:hypothetical protein